MGGGDLNTKKSWHPSTLKNQERVWKAEQAAERERQRTAELQRELGGERVRDELRALGRHAGTLPPSAPTDRLGWMYEKPGVSAQNEDFLLGKAIDNSYERAVGEEKRTDPNAASAPKNHVEHEVIPFSIRKFRGEPAGGSGQVDLARKLQEDPLLLVRAREREARAALLHDPRQRRRLAELLRTDQEKRKNKKAKKKSKKKKTKPDLDQLLADKLSELRGKTGSKVDLTSLLSGAAAPAAGAPAERRSEARGRGSDSSSDEGGSKKHEHKGRAPAVGPAERDLRRDESGRAHDGRTRADASTRADSKRREPAGALSEADKRRRREQMMRDAREHDEARGQRTRRAREEAGREEAARAGLDAQFAARQAARALGGSVEGRLRANVYNIQRGAGHMDEHFARRH